jgi:hypothetical protein
METINSNRLMQHMSNEMIAMSDRLMVLEVQIRDYDKLKSTFIELMDKCLYYRAELGLPNVTSSQDQWDYDMYEKSGLLDKEPDMVKKKKRK